MKELQAYVILGKAEIIQEAGEQLDEFQRQTPLGYNMNRFLLLC